MKRGVVINKIAFKKVVFIITTLAVLSIAVNAWAEIPPAEGTVFFEENFETYAENTYPTSFTVKYTGTAAAEQKVISTTGYDGNVTKVFRLESQYNWASEHIVALPEVYTQGALVIDAYVKPVAGSWPGRIGLYKNNPDGGGIKVSAVLFDDDSKITALRNGSDSSKTELGTYTLGNWYHVTMVHDMGSKTYDVYIDGVKAGTGIPMYTTDDATHINLTGGNLDLSEVYFDNISMYMAKTDAQKVAADKAALTEEMIKAANTDLTGVTTDLNLVTAIPDGEGCTISWASDNAAVIATDGTVTRPAYGSGDATVTLTASISSGTESDTAEFSVTVLEEELTVVSVSGTISADTTWSAGNIYVVNGDMAVSSGVTLTIEPGVIVKINGAIKIDVYGTLNAQGTTGNKIYFTDYRDDTIGGDTNGDGDSTSPAAGAWSRITFGNNGTGILDYCVLKYGGAGWGGWNFYNSPVYKTGAGNLTISNSEVSYSRLHGIFVENATGIINLTNNIVKDNGSQGIYSKNSSPNISGNTLNDNVQYGLYLEGTVLPGVVSGNVFGTNGSGSIGAAGIASGTNVASDNTGVTGIWVTQGTINSDTTWASIFPYVINTDILVDANIKLTIDPGVIVKINGAKKIDVNGTLNAQGTTGNKIYFTDYRDDTIGGDTNGDGDSTSPAAGAWSRITFGNNGTGILDYCVLKYGGAGWGGWNFYNSPVYKTGAGNLTISNSEVSYSRLHGIFVENATGIINLTNNIVKDNGSQGIYSKNSSPNISGNTLNDNVQYGLYLEGTVLPGVVSGNVFGTNGSGSIGAAGIASGTNVASDNTGVTGIWVTQGTINSDTTWASIFPYVINTDILVDANIKLTIDPGVIVKINGAKKIDINGTLDARGTAESQIYFTDYRDDTIGGDTNGDGDAASPAAGGWSRITFANNAAGILDYCVLKYGGGTWGGWSSYDSPVYKTGAGNLTISNSELSHNRVFGVKIIDAADVLITDTGISNSGSDGIYIKDSPAVISGGTFADNGNYGIRVDASADYSGMLPGIDSAAFSNNTKGAIYLHPQVSGTPVAGCIMANGAIEIGAGTIDRDTVLNSTNTYYIGDNINIYKNLTISQGCVVKLRSGGNITVGNGGNLIITGSEDNRVTLTSWRDNSIGENISDSTAPARGDWRGIIVSSGGTADIVYTDVKFGGLRETYSHNWYGDSIVKNDGGVLTIADSTIEQSARNGITIADTGDAAIDSVQVIAAELSGINISNASPNITQSTLNGNQTGIYISGTSNPIIGGSKDNSNIIASNTGFGVNNVSLTVIDAAYNDWGDPSGPYHAALNPEGLGNKVSDNVNFIPFVGMSSDATLSDLTVNGTTVAGFSPDTETYNVELPLGTTAVPTVAATVYDTGKAAAVVTPAESLPGTTTVTVTAQDGTTKVYTIYFTVATDMTPPEITAGEVNRISDTEAAVKFTSNEAGQYYYTVVADGAGEPVTDTGGPGVECDTSEQTIMVTGITAGAKDIYIQVKDAAGNISTALKIDIPEYIAPVTDADKVASDKAALTADLIKGTNTDLNNVTADLNLVTAIPDGAGCIISWASDNETVIVTDGTVTRPAYGSGDAEVTLTATLTSGAESDTAEFAIMVKELPGSSNGGGSSYTPPVIEVTTEKTDDITTTSTEVSATTSSGVAAANISTAVVDALLDEADAENGTAKGDVIEVSVNTPADTRKLEVTIPRAGLEKVTAKSDAGFGITSPFVSVTFDGKAIDTISGAAGGDNIIVSAGIIDETTLSEKDRAKVAGRPVYDLGVKNGDVQVSHFGGGHATVRIPYILKQGENLNAVVIYYLGDDGNLKTVRGRFDAAAGAVIFKTPHFSNFVIGHNPVTFSDVRADAWYKDAVDFIAARGVTSGTGDGIYSPDMRLTRGQFMVLLMNAYQIDPASGANDNTDNAGNFADAGNTYYTNYLAAAKNLGITNGVGNNMFAPDKEITRQEMFVLLYNALQLIDELPPVITDKELGAFSDADSVASWANEAMSALVKSGIVSGSDNMLSPADTTTRAQMAQVLYNLLVK